MPTTPEKCEAGQTPCSFCAKETGALRYIIGWYCKAGLRQACKDSNEFFVNLDGSPFIRIPDVEAYVTELAARQDAEVTA